jgi:hypothetical protein
MQRAMPRWISFARKEGAMRPGPITNPCLPPEFRDKFHVVTFDPKTEKVIDPVYQGSDEVKANKAFIDTVKRFERAKEEEGQEYEPAIVRIFGNGETKQELLIA